MYFKTVTSQYQQASDLSVIGLDLQIQKKKKQKKSLPKEVDTYKEDSHYHSPNQFTS